MNLGSDRWGNVNKLKLAGRPVPMMRIMYVQCVNALLEPLWIGRAPELMN
jgi:hypothetical protein